MTTLEDYLEFVEPDVIRIRGHRIGLEHIVAYYREGYTAEEIAREFPTLSLEQVYAALTYYLAHQAAVDAALARQYQQDERAYQQWAAAPSPVIQRLRALRERRASA
ncbi:MAG: DUF433 domain-containing protein [Chloroflexi bacterium]|nr:DUF433 domain-containing protein [Chloroflexota bacterium]